MSNDDKNLILGLPRRPRGDIQDAAGATRALVDLFYADKIVVGGIAGIPLTNQPLSLETAVRRYFFQNNLPVVSVYRSPKSVEVLFKSNNQFWKVKSAVPDSLSLGEEDIEDWLYGNLVKNEVPRKIKQIQNSTKL